MSGYQAPLLTAIAIATARKEHDDVERRIHRAAHNEITGTPCAPEDIDCFVSLVALEAADLHIRFYLNMEKSKPIYIVAQMGRDDWLLLPGGLLLKNLPEAHKSRFSGMTGSTLGNAGAINSAPWKDMRFTSTSEEEDGFHLAVPALHTNNVVGGLGYDGLRTWTGEWM